MKKTWRLDPKEIGLATSHYWSDSDPFDVILRPDDSHAYEPTGAQGRKRNKTNECLVMTHLPTDEQVHGKYQGYYTLKEKAQMREQLIGQLFLLLEKRVATKLAIPGRSK